MDTIENLDHKAEIKKLRKLLAKNMDEFKYLVLSNMRLDEKSKEQKDALHLDINRISDFQTPTAGSLEGWVNSGFAPKTDKKDLMPMTLGKPGETLEQWVAKQKVKVNKPKAPSRSIIDIIEQWLINEAKKDMFKELDAIYGGPEGLSSAHIRELAYNLISLADKLDKMKK